MSDEITKLAEETFHLEYLVSQLYHRFREIDPADESFWWNLAIEIEEGNHAALFRSGLDHFIPQKSFPEEMLAPVLSDLQEASQQIQSMLEQYQEVLPTRENAFNLALKIEPSTGEIDFQDAMTRAADTKALKLFQKLNNEEKDHFNRIQEYMKEKGIERLE